MDTVVDSKAVNDCLDKIRPYIQHDGGDIELLGVDEFNVVYVSFKGACQGCMMASEDFSGGIKELLLEEVPNIRDVVLVGKDIERYLFIFRSFVNVHQRTITKIINCVDVRTSFNRINVICRHHYGHQHRFGRYFRRFPCRFIKYFDHQYICRHGNWRRHHLRPILRIQPKRQGQPSLETIDFFRNSYFTDYYHSLHPIQKTPIKPDLWIRRKNRDGQFIKLSFHHRPILSLYRSI